ncbi:MAG: hypothetical protein H3C43_02810 [Leptonema sp. (in: Bacteria)]|nr:hypothetical protein [Leptonema sp. (in: bacteria)]
MNSDFMDSLDTHTDQPQSLDFDLDLELPELDDSDFGNFDSLSTDLGDIDNLPPADEQVASNETDEPVTLTADELNDIISVDFEDSGEPEVGELNDGLESSLEMPLDDIADIPLDISLPDDTEIDIETDQELPEIEDLELVDDENYETLDSDISVEPDDSLVLPGDLDLELPEIETEDLSIEFEPQLETDIQTNIDFDSDLISKDFSNDEFDSDIAADEIDLDDSILISDDELQQEILGNDDVQIPPLSILDSDDDDTITLTSDELSNIVSDGAIEFDETEAETEFEEVSDEIEPIDIDDITQDTQSEESSFFQEEDDTPVALTDDELADILGDTTVEEVVADELTPKRDETIVEEAADEAGVNRDELKKMIGYLDDLLGQLPEETVKEFSRSEYFQLYKKVIDDLGVFK